MRNPSWSRETDDLRGAYVDRIEIEFGQSPKSADDRTKIFSEALRRVKAGELDLIYDTGTTFTTHETVQRYQTDRRSKAACSSPAMRASST